MSVHVNRLALRLHGLHTMDARRLAARVAEHLSSASLGETRSREALTVNVQSAGATSLEALSLHIAREVARALGRQI
jgi:hypothetical protein